MLSLTEADDAFNLPYAVDAIAGVDEVGRGALFGPVVTAAVILSSDAIAVLSDAGVTDSKKLSARQRQRFSQLILEHALDCQMGWATVREIDRLNILQASLLAMKRAVLRLNPLPEFCWVDGNQTVPGLPMPQQALVKGDQRCLAIASASIVAKVWRDTLMERLDQKYPGYDIASNKGYGSDRHRSALENLGVTALHRRSFAPCQGRQGTLPFFQD
jgi:ribonuclease HII